MSKDTILLFTTRIIRMFAYGFLSVVLVLYLAQVGLNGKEIGLLLTLTLVGDAAISLWMTTSADRIGRKRMLILGAVLMALAGIAFALTNNVFLLMLAAVVGVISPSGKEIGPFLSIEQAALSQLVSDARRTRVFAWYDLAGMFAAAFGALGGGSLAKAYQTSGYTALESYQVVVIAYAACGVIITILFLFVTPSVEVAIAKDASPQIDFFGLHKSRRIVLKLSGLFALDAFAGGFILESMMAYWFHLKFGVDVEMLGAILFGANLLAGASALLAARIAERIGLINTMVFTHIPSNILLCLVPLMPTLSLAILMLMVRFSISRMDAPPRQSYTMAVVAPDERSAASGVTTIARSVGASLSPALSGMLLASPLLLSFPFFFRAD